MREWRCEVPFGSTSTCCFYTASQPRPFVLPDQIAWTKGLVGGGSMGRQVDWVVVERGVRGGLCALLCSDTPSVNPMEHSSCLWQVTPWLKDDDVSTSIGPRGPPPPFPFCTRPEWHSGEIAYLIMMLSSMIKSQKDCHGCFNHRGPQISVNLNVISLIS